MAEPVRRNPFPDTGGTRDPGYYIIYSPRTDTTAMVSEEIVPGMLWLSVSKPFIE
jgi:hypothetical protein